MFDVDLHMCFTKVKNRRVDNLRQDVVDLDFGNDFIDNCDYLDNDELKDIKITKNDLSILQLNIRGLINKQIELSKILNTSNKKKIDVVILSETWLNNTSIAKVTIPGYDFVGEHRINKKGGGVGILINSELKYKVRDDLKITSEIFENCSIEIKTNTANIIIGSIYRPPNTNQKEFLKQFDTYVDSINSNLEVVLGMDHNMDFLKSEQNTGTQQFMNDLLDREMYPLITKPTRITKTTATLIDNIIVSRALYSNSLSGIIINDMSSHLPCISILKNVKTRKGETVTVSKRDMKGQNVACLKRDLVNVNWDDLLCMKGISVNEQFEVFHDLLLVKLDAHCPVKSYDLSPKKILREPWLTKGLLRSYTKQKSLYKEFLMVKDEESELKYKEYRNTLQRIKRKEKQCYYNTQCL